MPVGSQTTTRKYVGAQEVVRSYLGATLVFGNPPGPAATTVGTTGGPGEIIFDPIAPLDGWTATTGNAGEFILEAA